MSQAKARTPEMVLAFHGQSLNRPAGTYCETLLSYYSNTVRADPWVGGFAWSQMAVAARLAWLDPIAKAAPVSVLVMCGGTTDYDTSGAAGATVYANEGIIAAYARSVGFDYVIGSTTNPSTTISGYADHTGDDAKRITGNALVLADASGFFDGVADFSSSPIDDATNATYYSDGVHVTPTAGVIMADRVRTILDDLLGL